MRLRIYRVIVFSFIFSITYAYSQESRLTDLLNRNSDTGLSIYQNLGEFHLIDFNLKKDYTHELDSTITYTFPGNDVVKSKSQYIFEDNKDLYVTWFWDDSELEWIPSSYVGFTFENGLLISQSFNDWDGDFTDLTEKDPQLLRTYDYNQDQQITNREDYAVSTDGALIHTRSESFIYENGLISRYDRNTWYFSVDSFVLRRTIEYEHRDSNQLEYILDTLYKTDGSFRSLDSTVVNYNEQSQLQSEINYYKSYTDDSLNLFQEYRYFYNPNGSLSKIWNIVRERLDGFRVFRYQYHPYGSLDQISSFVGFIENQDTTYDTTLGNGRLIYYHNDNVASNQVRYPRTRFSNRFFDNSHYYENHMIITEIITSGGTLTSPETLVQSTDYYYKELDPLSSENAILNNSTQIKVYPNPASSYIMFDSKFDIKGSNLHLFDYKGSKVNSFIIVDSQIDISALPSGVYFYKIEKDGKSNVGKILIENSF